MSSTHHTPHAFRAPLTSAELNRPLGQLDASIAQTITTGSGTTTTLTAQALAGQPNLVVASVDGMTAGDVVYIGRAGEAFESGEIASIASLTITLTANLANTHASGKPVSKSPVELVDARDGAASLGARLDFMENVVNVKRFGATGNGTTDDTAAITAAIASMSAGDVLYFPAGTYSTTGGFTLNKLVKVLGAGKAAREDVAKTGATRILCSSATASVFTVTAHGCAFEGFTLENTHASPTAGAGITVTSGDHTRFRDITVAGFFNDIDVQDGAHWVMDGCDLWSPVTYALKIAHVDLPDGGDQSISNSYFYAGVRDSIAAIRVESGGGLKINNVKVNTSINDLFHFAHGLDIQLGANINTSVLMVSNVSIENTTSHAIRMRTHATKPSNWDMVVINGLEVAFYASADVTARAISIEAQALGDIDTVVINAVTARFGAGGATERAIYLENAQHVAIGTIEWEGFADVLHVVGSSDIVAAPRGTVSYSESTVDSAGFTTTTTDMLTGATFLAKQGHRYRLMAEGQFQSSVAGDRVDVMLRDGANNVLQIGSLVMPIAAAPVTVHVERYWLPTGGNQTVKMSAARSSGTGTITRRGLSSMPSILVVDDLGPAT